MIQQTTKTLSVVVPTYNCRKLIERHLDSLMQWADLAYEFIIVDSRSTDGTLEYLKSNLKHPRIKIIERDRGLYESWNEGIAATTGDWIYISTAGDTITRDHLSLLLNEGQMSQADVLISPQHFVNENGEELPPHIKMKTANIYDGLKAKSLYEVSPSGSVYFAFMKAKPNALLGSCASDLFRGNHLRHRPFPVEYETHGDTAWILRYASETSILIINEPGAKFTLHEKTTANTQQQLRLILGRMLRVEASRCTSYYVRKTLQQIKLIRLLKWRRRVAWRTPKNIQTAKIKWVLINLYYLWSVLRLKLINIRYRMANGEKIIIRLK